MGFWYLLHCRTTFVRSEKLKKNRTKLWISGHSGYDDFGSFCEVGVGRCDGHQRLVCWLINTTLYTYNYRIVGVSMKYDC